MKRFLGSFGMALAGAALALLIQQNFLADRTVLSVAPATENNLPVRQVLLPTAGGGTSLAVDFTEAAERTVNAVVHVTTMAQVQQRDPFADFFFRGQVQPRTEQRRGAGSGVIIGQDGYIVTNNHVIEGADDIQVSLNDMRSFPAKVVGRDPSTDIALLKIESNDLPTLQFANSDDVRVGEWVLAVGNPMNLTSTVTAGIVSAKARSINILQYDPNRDVFPIESFIQTDAAVNPGNSGGALVSADGSLIGINSAIASTTGAYTGYSFAVPANIVRKVTADLMEFGHVQRAYLGVAISDVDQTLANELGMARPSGVYVKEVQQDGAARKAGIEKGDVIVKVGAMSVGNVPQLQEQVGRFRPGDEVAVTVMRGGKERVVNLALRGRDGGDRPVIATRTPSVDQLGAELRSADSKELESLKLQQGVKVEAVNGGKFRSIGIKPGFVITRIDQENVKAPADVERILSAKKGGVLIEGVYPNGMRAYYGLGL